MNLKLRIGHRGLCLLLAALLLSGVEVASAGTWFNKRITWRYGKEGLPWKATITDPQGRSRYQLILQPLWALEGGVVALEIVVARPEQSDVNLLGERENGIEYPYVITVEELEKGLAHSKFGSARRLHVESLIVNVQIEHFRLGRGLGSGSTYCPSCRNLQQLSVRITVNSAPSEMQAR